MRFSYSDYPRSGMDFEQIEAWQKEAITLTAISIDELPDSACLEAASKIKNHTLRLFTDEGSEFLVHGITRLRPEYSELEDADERNWELLKDSFFDSNLRVDTDGAGTNPQQCVYDCISVAAALERTPLIRAHVDAARQEIGAYFESDRQTFGNKFANLRATEVVTKHLNELLGEKVYAVPPFTGIPTSLHRQYREGSLAIENTVPYYTEIQNMAGEQGFWVRSSATESEDGEDTTAAGLYESVFVPAGGTIEDFYSAVEKVYQSVDSEEAKHYRAEHCISTESMGIVLQVNSSLSEDGDWGYSNSVVPGINSLQEVFISEDHVDGLRKPAIVRMPYVRDKTLLDITSRPHTYNGMVWWDTQVQYSKAPYFAFDERRTYPEANLKAAYLSRFGELVYGRPVQQEFIATRRDIDVVQTRPLPARFAETHETFEGFPDQPYLFSGRALGIANGIVGKPLPITHLSELISQSDEDHIVISEDNFGASSTPPYLLKQAKAVIVISDTIGRQMGARGAHIETLCAEMGIPCSFATKIDAEGEDQDSSKVYSRLLGRNTLTLYLDGLMSRVY